MPPRQIAIIGAGCSGTLLAVQLLRRARGPLAIELFDLSGRFGPGLAYSTGSPVHLLNVAASRMSALPDEPDHFVRWLRERGTGLGPEAYAPRALFGEYLQELLAASQRAAAPGVQLEAFACPVKLVRPHIDNGGEVVMERLSLEPRGMPGRNHDAVALALGNFPPADPPLADAAFYESPRYLRDPWAPEALSQVRNDESLLLIGTGLTAVDVVVELRRRGHGAPLRAISRHGLRPRAHVPSDVAVVAGDPTVREGMGVRQAVAAVRRATLEAAERGDDWRGVVDGLRPTTQAVWRGWTVAERERFVRHVRPWWDVHRHRMAPQIDAELRRAQADGQLCVHAARLVAMADDGDGVCVSIRPRGSNAVETLRVERVINCTGPAGSLRDVPSRLLLELLDPGLARLDPLGLGFDTTDEGQLIGREGQPTPRLFALGPLRRGTLWESTAVPEIRAQAAALAERLLTAT